VALSGQMPSALSLNVHSTLCYTVYDAQLDEMESIQMGIQILDAKLIEQIERLARDEQCPEEQVVARAIRLHEKEARAACASSILLSIAKLGSSAQGDVAERDEEILASEIDQKRGCTLKRNES
jgi:hypothetical protein